MIRYLLPALLAMMATSAPAEVIRWKTVGGWDVSFYSSQEGCLAYTKYQRGTQFYIGFDGSFGDIHIDVSLIDSRWASIEEGKEYAVTVKFGNEVPWNLDMSGRRFNRTPGLLLNYPAVSDEARRFLREFMRETKMVWSYDGIRLGDYSLRGSQAAMTEVIKCQRSYEEAANNNPDPFSP